MVLFISNLIHAFILNKSINNFVANKVEKVLRFITKHFYIGKESIRLGDVHRQSNQKEKIWTNDGCPQV